MLVAMALLGQLSTGAIAPADDWQVGSASGAWCTAERRYPLKGHALSLKLSRSITSDETYELVVEFTGDAKPGNALAPTLSMRPSGNLKMGARTGGKAPAYYYHFDASGASALARSTSIIIDPKLIPAFELELKNMEAAMTELRRCRSDQLRAWNVNEDEVFSIPLGETDRWVLNLPYPKNAKQNRGRIQAIVLVTLPSADRPGSCRVLSSAGSADLDQASCDAVRKKGEIPGSANSRKTSAVVAVNWR